MTESEFFWCSRLLYMCLRRAVRHRSFFVNLRRPESRPKSALRQRMPPHSRFRGKHRTQNGAYGNYGRHNFKAVFCVFPFVLHTHSPDTLWENNNITEQKIKRLCRISTSYLLIPSAMYLNTGAQSKAPPAPFSLKTVMT